MFVKKTHEREMWSINFLFSERLLFLLTHDTVSPEVHNISAPPLQRATQSSMLICFSLASRSFGNLISM